MRCNNLFCNKISIKSYIKNQNLSNKAKFNYKFNVHFNFLLGLEFLLFVDILSFHFKRKYKDWRSLITIKSLWSGNRSKSFLIIGNIITEP
jgi:hypothetical protein